MSFTLNRTGGYVLTAVAVLTLPGCYEEVEPQQPQAPAQPGPITSMSNQGGGSALGGAKRGATNIIKQAEQKSQEVAREADPTAPEPPPAEEEP